MRVLSYAPLKMGGSRIRETNFKLITYTLTQHVPRNLEVGTLVRCFITAVVFSHLLPPLAA